MEIPFNHTVTIEQQTIRGPKSNKWGFQHFIQWWLDNCDSEFSDQLVAIVMGGVNMNSIVVSFHTIFEYPIIISIIKQNL